MSAGKKRNPDPSYKSVTRGYRRDARRSLQKAQKFGTGTAFRSPPHPGQK